MKFANQTRVRLSKRVRFRVNTAIFSLVNAVLLRSFFCQPGGRLCRTGALSGFPRNLLHQELQQVNRALAELDTAGNLPLAEF